MQKQNKPLILAVLAGLTLSGAAHAGLIGRDLNGSATSFEAYYDNDRNITWLANASVIGATTWAAANVTAASLSFTDGANTYANWRLPTTLQPDPSCSAQQSGLSMGYGCTGSEMGHLFYSELGGTAGQSILTSSDPDLAKFTNLQSGIYWSATEFALATDYAWVFDFGSQIDGGFQGSAHKLLFSSNYALAVSPGDVGAANNDLEPVPLPVPEPQTLALLGLGLLGLAAARRRR